MLKVGIILKLHYIRRKQEFDKWREEKKTNIGVHLKSILQKLSYNGGKKYVTKGNKHQSISIFNRTQIRHCLLFQILCGILYCTNKNRKDQTKTKTR